MRNTDVAMERRPHHEGFESGDHGQRVPQTTGWQTPGSDCKAAGAQA